MQYKDIIADEFGVSVWPKSHERTGYYEIIGIREGRGIHTARGAELPFKSGDLFFSLVLRRLFQPSFPQSLTKPGAEQQERERTPNVAPLLLVALPPRLRV